GAGIGGGRSGSIASLSITGGTVYPVAGSGASALGRGAGDSNRTGPVTVDGGAVYADLAAVQPAPVNTASAAVFPVDFDIGEPTNHVTNLELGLAFSSYSYGSTDLYTDAGGNLRLWLPSTQGKSFSATITMEGGEIYYFVFGIDDDGTVKPVDFLVANGKFVPHDQDAYGNGWIFDYDTKILELFGDVTLSGISTNGAHRIHVPAGGASRITLDRQGLVLAEPATKYLSPIVVSNDCTLVLAAPSADSVGPAPTNTVTARGQYAAGIEVAPTATLTIAAPSDPSTDRPSDRSTLVVTGGDYGAGIGSRGGSLLKPGRIVIESGTILAQGGKNAAGIGAGLSANLQEGGIEIRGGNVTATGGSAAAGIGGGKASVQLPDGAVKISGGTVLATHGGSISMGGDLVQGAGNTVSISGGAKPFVVTGGSVHGAHLAHAPNPVDAAGAQLRYWLFEGLEPGATPVFGEGLPAGYGLSGVVADATGSVCLWLPSTNAVRSVMLDGKYFSGGSATNNVFSIESGSDEPPDSIREDGRTKWRVAVSGLVASAATEILGLEAAGVSSVTAALDGRTFVYLPDGEHSFSADGFDYVATVEGAPAAAQLVRTGVTVDGVDACALSGDGWAFLLGERVVSLTKAGPFTISGSATNVGIRAGVDCAATLEDLSLTNAAAHFAPFDCASRSVALSLAGTNALRAARDGMP
ncbi:MAG: hypothetical protein IJL06_09250, partial [Kiritimatiellae bacterium]|nr:hypothetical protein [Kiritimatiellia bacterium]